MQCGFLQCKVGLNSAAIRHGAVSCRMGVLMEAANVNHGRDGGVPYCPKTEVTYSKMAVPGGHYKDIGGYVIETRNNEFDKIMAPVPLRIYKQAPIAPETLNPPYIESGTPSQTISSIVPPHKNGFTTTQTVNASKEFRQKDHIPNTARPPKKKWIKEYLEEELPPPSSPVSVTVVTSLPLLPPRSNGVVVPRASTPVSVHGLHAPAPTPAVAIAAAAAPLHQPDFIFEHSRPRSNSHGPSIPSPSSSCSGTSTRDSGVGSNTSGVRAGTREVHNKLEKNRRAHLKECFELLKRQLPANNDDKKASNLAILGSANRYIQVLRRKERECEHEMERLAREKIAAQQRLAALKREVSIRHNHTPRVSEASPTEERDREERINGHLLGIPISITSTAGSSGGLSPQPAITTSELRTLPVHITPSTGVVRAAYGARHNTFTLTTLATDHVSSTTTHQNGQPGENGLSPALGTALVHPAHLHLPLSQVVRSGLVVGGTALQLVSGPAGALRILNTSQHLTPTSGGAGREAARLPVENGVSSSTASTEVNTTGSAGSGTGSVMVSGLAPLVVSQGQAHLLHTHSFTHKMMETQVVSAQYLSTATLMKPVVVVSTTAPPPAASTVPAPPSASRT